MAFMLYGIPNCDSVKAARKWLSGKGVDYAFHDYKKMGVDRSRLAAWIEELGWESLLNKSGTTFRKLPESEKVGIDAERAFALMVEQPSMIKRPILDLGDRRVVGFKPDAYEEIGEFTVVSS